MSRGHPAYDDAGPVAGHDLALTTAGREGPADEDARLFGALQAGLPDVGGEAAFLLHVVQNMVVVEKATSEYEWPVTKTVMAPN
jgi:hypothetical protein